MSLKGPHGIKLNAAYTSQEFRLMTVAELNPDENGDNFGEYVFCQANGAIDRGALCQITHDGQASEQDTTSSGSTRKRDGVAQAALADNEWGWFWRGRGKTEALVANGISAGAALTTTATAGVLGSGGDAVASCLAVDANATGSTALVTIEADNYISTN